MYPLDIVAVGIGLAVLNLLVGLPLRLQQKVHGNALIGGTVVLLPVQVDKRIAVEVDGDVVLGLGGVEFLVEEDAADAQADLQHVFGVGEAELVLLVRELGVEQQALVAQFHQQRDLLSLIEVENPGQFVEEAPADEVLALRFNLVAIVLFLVEVEAVVEQVLKVVEVLLRGLRLHPLLVLRLQPAFQLAVDELVALRQLAQLYVDVGGQPVLQDQELVLALQLELDEDAEEGLKQLLVFDQRLDGLNGVRPDLLALLDRETDQQLHTLPCEA